MTNTLVENVLENSTFEIFGWFREYYVDGKFIGAVRITEPDRTHIGYAGRTNTILMRDITLNNKKRLKSGISVDTILYPLCGKKK